ncbi:FAD-binding oxidoreductase [Nocardioides humilatus]|uniref:FAD-binding oxidoreductase n=1 Tax=Nocardioides humilatus TaxID=2607660 RepID=A0A5B1LJE3_9ACTN|nr:FAD-binding oxidoreductase [Nocardioides humilatus]KAA1420832.1 FAD-binding oxidoreductase [Nocardioides humilatus]
MTIERDLPCTDSDIDTAAHALRSVLGDRVTLPCHDAYDLRRTAWNLAVDQRPAAIALPRSAAEVATVVRLAAENGLKVAPQSTGHNARPLAERGLDDVVLLRMSELDLTIADPARGIIRAQGGALWEAAVVAAAAHGRAVLHGSSPDVGIAGYTLGGGIGWYARKLGLAANSVTAIEVVLADGSLVRADAQHDAELFWALRGGGGNLGVVTALEFSTFDIQSAYAGLLMWDLADVEPVLREWAAWAPEAPDEVTTSFRVLRFPLIPDVPPFLAGRQVAIIDGAVLGSDARGAELLAGLRALKPELDTFTRMPAQALDRLHLDPEGGAPAVSDTSMLAGMPDAAIDAWLAEVGPDSSTSLNVVELRQLGGALARAHEGGGVLTHLDGAFAAFNLAMAPTPDMGAQGHADAVRVTEALAPYSTGATYLNFAENPTDVRTGYRPEAWRQLVGIRSAVDPHGVFLANHAVPRLFEDGVATS